jgi:DNA-binding Lrp family transcriptional regulator
MISELEKAILRSLNADARKSFREVAKEVKTSTTAIYNNVKKMEKNGLLKGYIPVLDEELLGYTISAIIVLRIAQGKLENVYQTLASYPEVRMIFDITGEWDTILFCSFMTRQEMDHFLKHKLTLDYVERVVTHLVLNVVKNEKRTPV